MDDNAFDFSQPGEFVTPLDRLDRVIASLPPGDPVRADLLDLRIEFAELEDTMT